MSILTPLPPSSHAKPVDSFAQAAELEAELKRTVKGDVRFDRGTRAMYATDASNYRQVPIGLVTPRDEEDVIATVAACRKYGAPVLPRGAGTSVAGQSCNVAVVLDFTPHMNKVLSVDPERKTARVQPGVVLDSLQNVLKPHGLIFAPDPSTHSRCTIGGMIGNNSCGAHSLLGGKTVDNIDELKVLLYDGTLMTVGAVPESELAAIIAAGGRRGEIHGKLRDLRDRHSERIRARYPRIPRRVSGYNLDELLPENGFHVARALVGTEGTCAVVLEAGIRLIHNPQHRALAVLGYEDGFVAGDHVPEILEFKPIGLEGLEGIIIDGLRRKRAPNLDLMPEGGGFLLVEFGADDQASADALAQKMIARLKQLPGPPDARVYSGEQAKAIWHIRESGPRAAAFAPGAPPEFEGWDDAAVPPDKVGAYLRDIRKLMDEYNYRGAFYGHFGDGCIHMRITFDLESEGGIRNYAEFVDRAADLVIGYGGSLSGEHGDGQSRATLLPKMFGPELVGAFREFKTIWDPDRGMNPGKVVDPYPPTENLRLGADYKPHDPPTEFKYPDDDGSFAKASFRCLGVGACRKLDSGGMCPSYMATLDEEHSTRGRAHILFEMLQGEVITQGWRSEEVKRSLDLCLSCKACKTECPANVDMATYKAEFLSHYYEGRALPLRAHIFGRIDRWAQLAALAPGAANLLARLPGISHLMRAALGIAPERKLPRFARQTFLSWAAQHKTPVLESGAAPSNSPLSREVILWVDTFNNHFHPETSMAALEALTDAGFKVLVPEERMCCGRPLYDFGMVAMARRYLLRIMESLRGAIRAGTPIVVLEPSCASVFRDELHNLFPEDPRAEQLRNQVCLLSEFLERHAPDYRPPQAQGEILLHGHCHQKALMKMDHEEALLRKTGARVRTPDAGCCGMAGPFGFEKEKYAISQAIGERVLLPAVRQASPETIIVADGFSCREQIEQATGRRAVHLAEALARAKGALQEHGAAGPKPKAKS